MPATPVTVPMLFCDLVLKTTWAYRRSRLYYSADQAPADEAALEAIADVLFGIWAPKLAALMSDEHLVQRVEVKWYSGAGAYFFAHSAAAAVEGDIDTGGVNNLTGDPSTASEDILPDEAAVIIQKKTGKTGRANQGRLFITGLAEHVNFAGEVSSQYRGAVKALATQLPLDVNVAHENYTGVLHARHWNKKLNVFHPITKAYAVNAIGTRRDRRKPVPYERL